MGYTTLFKGEIEISPPLTPEQSAEVQAFCDERHGGNLHVHPGMPGFYCDYLVAEDGASIGWNGSEKSYEMVYWLRVLIGHFFVKWGRTLNGEMLARGERFDDVWTIAVRNNVVSRKEGWTR
jgi:hypothetical protein